MVDIHYLTYQQINKKKWDACIDKAENGLIYAYSFYLDAMARNWDALVLYSRSGEDAYEAVMPLTWNKKYGIHYLYQPPFAACLGIFGNSLNGETVNAFLKTVPAKFKYWDIYFNPGNLFKLTNFELYQRMNYVLALDSPYETLYSAFRENIQRNIKKSEQFQLAIKNNIPISDVLRLAKEQANSYSSLSDDDFNRFEKLFVVLLSQQKAITYGVYSKEGQLIASAVFLFSHHRAYYILVGNHPDGKTLGASHAMINAFIKDHAGKGLLLDFEGSDIPSLAFFYSSFGAVEERYSAIQLNRLPVFLKWMKK